MLKTWKSMSSIARSEALLHHDDLPIPVEIRGIRGAKRLRLRLDEKRSVLKLTGPFRMNRKAALNWAVEQREWVETQLEAMLPAEPFVPGAVVPFEGKDVRLEWNATARRTAELMRERLVCGGYRGKRRRSRKKQASPLAAFPSGTPTRDGEAALPQAGFATAGGSFSLRPTCAATSLRTKWRILFTWITAPHSRRWSVSCSRAMPPRRDYC